MRRRATTKPPPGGFFSLDSVNPRVAEEPNACLQSRHETLSSRSVESRNLEPCDFGIVTAMIEYQLLIR